MATAVFYFFLLFSHLRIRSQRKFAMTPAMTEVRRVIRILKSIYVHLFPAARFRVGSTVIIAYMSDNGKFCTFRYLTRLPKSGIINSRLITDREDKA